MLRTIALTSLLLLLAAPASASDAARACSPASWDCIGAIEMHVGERALRMSRYANDEMLSEIEVGGVSQRLLVAQPSGAEVYFGLSAQQTTSLASNPFAFFDYAFAMPVAAVRLAFPNGPASVPAAPVQRDVLVEGNPVTVNASKLGDGRIDFRVDGAAFGRISGQIVLALLPPLDGAYPLAAWLHKSGAHFTALSDARRAPR